MSAMKRAGVAATVSLGGLAAVLATQTYLYGSARVPRARSTASAPVKGAAERLAGAIRLPTVSAEDPREFDAAAFDELHEYLGRAFPRVHATLRRETVARH